MIADLVGPASYALRRGAILTRFGPYDSAMDYSCLTPTAGPGRLHPLELFLSGHSPLRLRHLQLAFQLAPFLKGLVVSDEP